MPLGDLMRTLELYEERVELGPVFSSDGEFAVGARIDVLEIISLKSYRMEHGVSYLIKVVKLITTILAIPGLRLLLHWFPLLGRRRPAMSWARVVGSVFLILMKDTESLLRFTLGSPWRWVAVIVNGSPDFVHVGRRHALVGSHARAAFKDLSLES